MWWNGLKMRTLVALAIAAALGLVAVPASADKPSSAGGGKDKHGKSSKQYQNEKSDKGDKHKKDYGDSKHGKYDKHFRNHDRDVVRHYYGEDFRKGKGCPPGLAKKHNGCMPPGQAKKRWRYGHPLPRDVVFYELPRQLVLKLPAPPDGYRYVRVASDILLIIVGTGMVVDAIQDLGLL